VEVLGIEGNFKKFGSSEKLKLHRLTAEEKDRLDMHNYNLKYDGSLMFFDLYTREERMINPKRNCKVDAHYDSALLTRSNLIFYENSKSAAKFKRLIYIKHAMRRKCYVMGGKNKPGTSVIQSS
jgi:hypothetical protein